MRRLCLVRHAPTHAKAMVGWTDLPADCSDLGAFDRLRQTLPAQASLVSSDLVRAMATADRLPAQTRLAPHPGLREIHFGDWEMRAFAEIEAEDPQRLRAFWDEPGEVRPPGGESWSMLTARVIAALEDLLASTTGDLIAVSHFGPIIAAIQRAEGLSPIQAFAHRIDNLSMTEIAIDGGDWRLIRANHRP